VELTGVTKNTDDPTLILTKYLLYLGGTKLQMNTYHLKKERIVFQTKPTSQTSLRHLQNAPALVGLTKPTP